MGCVCSKKHGEDMQYVDFGVDSDYKEKPPTKEFKKENYEKSSMEGDDFVDVFNRTNFESNVYRTKQSK
jgi:hypothetical protein